MPAERSSCPGMPARGWGLPQTGGAAWTSQHAGRRNLVAAGRTVEPVIAVFALGLGKSLLFLALGAQAIHLALFDVLGEKKAAAGAFFGVTLADFRSASWLGTVEYRPASAAAIFSLLHFLANGALVHDRPHSVHWWSGAHRCASLAIGLRFFAGIKKAGLLGPGRGAAMSGAISRFSGRRSWRPRKRHRGLRVLPRGYCRRPGRRSNRRSHFFRGFRGPCDKDRRGSFLRRWHR